MAISISMILLRSAPELSADEIRSYLKTTFPDLPPSGKAKQDGVTLSFSLGDAEIIYGIMPAPFPWSDLEGPCETSILWPQAKQELKEHQQHIIATVMAELDEIESARLLTQVTAALMATCPQALGVYWGNATLLVPKKIFVEFAEKILPEGPPLDIWVDFRVGRDSESTSSGFTTGMAALGHMDFEAKGSPEPPGELRQRLSSLCYYVLENGPVIKDGDTIGEDANEIIRVVHRKSSFGQEGKVMRLEYEEQSPAKPWWKLW